MKLYDNHSKEMSQPYCKTVNQLHKAFPREPEVLYIAINTAYRQKAFSDAIQLAKDWLTLEPLNQKAKNVLLDTQLAYVKSELKKTKGRIKKDVSTLLSEIESNVSRSNNNANVQSVIINNALIDLMQKSSKKAAIQRLEDCLSKAENKLAFCCQLLLEAEQYGIKPDALTCLPQTIPQTQHDIEMTFKQLEKYKQSIDWSGAASKTIQVFLAPAKTLELPKPTWIWISQLLIEFNCYELAKRYTKQGGKQFYDEPLLIYYSIVANIKNNPDNAMQADIENLNRAMECVEKKGDVKALQLIGTLMQDILALQSGSGDMFFDIMHELKQGAV